MTAQARPTHERGFVLVETLVALTVFAVVTTAVFVAVQGALRADGEARFRALATVLGRSALEAVEASPPTRSGPAGRLDAGDHRVTVTAACDQPAPALLGCRLVAEVADTAGRRLELSTYRLFPTP